MLPDFIHFGIMLLLWGTLLRVAIYLMAGNDSTSKLYKFLTFAY